MNYCRQCKIYIKDTTSVCPLCQNVLEKNVLEKNILEKNVQSRSLPENKKTNNSLLEDNETDKSLLENNKTDKNLVDHNKIKVDTSKESMYPNVSVPRERFSKLYRSCAFVAVLAMILLGFINYKTYSPDFKMKWALICDVSIFYLLMTFRYFLFHSQGESNTKASFQILGVMVICIIIDYVTGFVGWSIDYAVPSVILLVETVLVILMIANNREWEKYLVLQVIMVGLSICNLLLKIPQFLKHPLLSMITCAISVVLFLGTCVIGDRKAKAELGRRFHI